MVAGVPLSVLISEQLMSLTPYTLVSTIVSYCTLFSFFFFFPIVYIHCSPVHSFPFFLKAAFEWEDVLVIQFYPFVLVLPGRVL